MGIWNVGIFQNDIACDVKEEYIGYLKDGLSDIEAEYNVIESNKDIINLGGYDALEFWLGLALIEWKYGRLQEATKKIALEMARDKKYLLIWKEENALYNKRLRILEEFIEIIQSEQPPKKKIRIITPFNCIWKVGDIFAYQLKSKISVDKGYFNKYIIFQKIGESEAHPKNIIPIIRVANIIFDEVPVIDDYLATKKIIWFGSPKDYERKSLIIYRDTFLYDKKMYVKSLKSYPKNIIYIGNNLPIKKEYKEGKIFGENYSEWTDFEEIFFEFYEKWLNVDETRYI